MEMLIEYLLYRLCHVLYSFWLLIRQVLAWIARVAKLGVSEESQLQAGLNKCKKVPYHVGFAFSVGASLDERKLPVLLNKVHSLIGWCLQFDIGEITLFDHEGVLQNHFTELASQLHTLPLHAQSSQVTSSLNTK